MWIAVGADQPRHGADARKEVSHAVGDLGQGDDHERTRIDVKLVHARVAHNADDLACGFIELRAVAFTNLNQLTDRILIRPVFPGHSLVDDDHAGCACGIAVAEVAAPDDGNLENIKVTRRSADPARAPGELILAQWTPHNVEGQPVAGF